MPPAARSRWRRYWSGSERAFAPLGYNCRGASGTFTLRPHLADLSPTPDGDPAARFALSERLIAEPDVAKKWGE